jgi:Spx/MgsR family transcriptional regulator
MPAKPKFYWKSTCTSCRNARKVLQERDVEVEDINYARKALDAETLASIVQAAGGVAKVLNTRHEIAKTKGWATQPPDEAAFVAAAANEPNLLRRPILVRGKTVLVGYDKTNEARWSAL